MTTRPNAAARVYELLGLAGGRRDRLLDDHVPPGAEGAQNVIEVHRRRRGDVHGLHLVVFEQAVK